MAKDSRACVKIPGAEISEFRTFLRAELCQMREDRPEGDTSDTFVVLLLLRQEPGDLPSHGQEKGQKGTEF